MKLASPKNTRICVFCKHWCAQRYEHIIDYSAISVWTYDDFAKEKCAITNLPRESWASCGKFERRY